jgi:ATP-dependent DNA helicase RecG
MSYRILGPDPVEDQLNRVLALLSQGKPPSLIELSQVDVKEEPGRRGRDGTVLPGQSKNEQAAQYLVSEMACLANTPGGGAIILGIADDGKRIGTEIDADWLRHRIWEMSEHKLTVTIREAELEVTRILLLVTHEAIEPIRAAGKLKWRVDDNCVEIDATSWHAGKMLRSGFDWSAQPSGHIVADAQSVALEVARRYLRSAGDPGSIDLAEASDHDLLRRLSVVDGQDRLTNAGSLLFVGTPEIGIDYIRRQVPAGDSTNRLRTRGPLLEQVYEVDNASSANNRLVHRRDGLAAGQLRAIPSGALREAVVNGVVHRDWLSPEPTTVEHIGDELVVTSPGGFIGGIGPSNIITHPSVPRYRSLAEAMATLRLAEREGIGVDRMVRDMLALGHKDPNISEISGPYVRVGLIGGDPDESVVRFLSRVLPSLISTDLNALLVIAHLMRIGWIDEESAGRTLQRPLQETTTVLNRLLEAQYSGGAVLTRLKGVPAGQLFAYRLGDASRKHLANGATNTHVTSNHQMVITWAEARGRVSSAEAADLTGMSQVSSGRLLMTLANDGLLRPGRATQGRGFFYVPTSPQPGDQKPDL